MNVTLQNNGLVNANAVYGELISPDSRITVSDADGYFGTVTGEGGQGSNTSDTFEVTANYPACGRNSGNDGASSLQCRWL